MNQIQNNSGILFCTETTEYWQTPPPKKTSNGGGEPYPQLSKKQALAIMIQLIESKSSSWLFTLYEVMPVKCFYLKFWLSYCMLCLQHSQGQLFERYSLIAPLFSLKTIKPTLEHFTQRHSNLLSSTPFPGSIYAENVYQGLSNTILIANYTSVKKIILLNWVEILSNKREMAP